MINEILFMETRIFREFCQKYKLSAVRGNHLFNVYRVWNYIETCYDILHTSGDEYILEDISNMLKVKGAAL